MITIRKSEERGKSDYGWLKANFSFSFASYFDPKWMGFKALRVINEDYIDEGMGFETHPHKNMEIISFIIDGAMAHKDTLGSETVIKPGEIQVMSAGTGIMHSEFNPNSDQKTHSLQIWVKPNVLDVKPRYDQAKFENPTNGYSHLLSSFDGEGLVKIHQDMNLYLGHFTGESFSRELDKNKAYWIHTVKGSAAINDINALAGDSLGIELEDTLTIKNANGLEFLLFELN